MTSAQPCLLLVFVESGSLQAFKLGECMISTSHEACFIPRVPAKEYARLARACQRLVLSGVRGKQLHEALASKLGLTVSQVRNRIERARNTDSLERCRCGDGLGVKTT